MIYAYVRVSSATQNISRQLEEIKKFDIEQKNIFIDYQSSKDFNRKGYKKLIKKIKENDVLVIKSIDRLGRNYIEIGEQWKFITQTKKVNMIVIDMPILNTKNEENNLINKFVADLILQLLSFIAENKRNNIKQRQAEGIKIAKEKGVKFGRPSFLVNDEFKKDCSKYKNKTIELTEILVKYKLSRSTVTST